MNVTQAKYSVDDSGNGVVDLIFDSPLVTNSDEWVGKIRETLYDDESPCEINVIGSGTTWKVIFHFSDSAPDYAIVQLWTGVNPAVAENGEISVPTTVGDVTATISTLQASILDLNGYDFTFDAATSRKVVTTAYDQDGNSVEVDTPFNKGSVVYHGDPNNPEKIYFWTSWDLIDHLELNGEKIYQQSRDDNGVNIFAHDPSSKIESIDITPDEYLDGNISAMVSKTDGSTITDAVNNSQNIPFKIKMDQGRIYWFYDAENKDYTKVVFTFNGGSTLTAERKDDIWQKTSQTGVTLPPDRPSDPGDPGIPVDPNDPTIIPYISSWAVIEPLQTKYIDSKIRDQKRWQQAVISVRSNVDLEDNFSWYSNEYIADIDIVYQKFTSVHISDDKRQAILTINVCPVGEFTVTNGQFKKKYKLIDFELSPVYLQWSNKMFQLIANTPQASFQNMNAILKIYNVTYDDKNNPNIDATPLVAFIGRPNVVKIKNYKNQVIPLSLTNYNFTLLGMYENKVFPQTVAPYYFEFHGVHMRPPVSFDASEMNGIYWLNFFTYDNSTFVGNTYYDVIPEGIVMT